MITHKKEYYISMEVSGERAFFGRNDSTGNCERTYPAPTYSVVYNWFKCIVTPWSGLDIIPMKVEICNPLKYEEFKCNYEVGLGENKQYKNIILKDVRYKVYARLDGYNPNFNVRHGYQVRFNCRLKMHKKLVNPDLYLGRREYFYDYMNHLDPSTKPYPYINETIYGMHKEFKIKDGKRIIITYPEIKIVNGVMMYD